MKLNSRAGTRAILLLCALVPAFVLAGVGRDDAGGASSTDQAAVRAGFSWRSCVSPDWLQTTFPFTADLKPRPDCFPDTLYAWRTKSAVQRISAFARQGTGLLPPITKGSGYFFWRTPIGSYGYGDVPLRVKLRPGTNFIPYVPVFDAAAKDYEQRRCETLRAKFGDDLANSSVFVTRINRMFSATPSELLASYSEYILCSDEPVESWSTGTVEGRAEILREKHWIETHDLKDYDALIRDSMNNTYWVNPAVNDVLELDDGSKTKTWVFDGHDWSRDSLEAKMAGLDRLVPGEIFFAAGTPRSRLRHFETNRASYFNPFGLPTPARK